MKAKHHAPLKTGQIAALASLFNKIDEAKNLNSSAKNYLKQVLVENINKSFIKKI